MSHSEFNIGTYHPVYKGRHRPEPFVQKRHLRVNREVKPRNGLKSYPVEDIGEKFVRRGDNVGTRNAGTGWRSDLGKRIIEIDVKIAVDIEPIESRGITPSLESVPHPEAQYCPLIERIDRTVLGEIDRLQFGTRDILVNGEDIGGFNRWGRDP